MASKNSFAEVAEWLIKVSGTLLNCQRQPRRGEAHDVPNNVHAISARETIQESEFNTSLQTVSERWQSG